MGNKIHSQNPHAAMTSRTAMKDVIMEKYNNIDVNRIDDLKFDYFELKIIVNDEILKQNNTENIKKIIRSVIFLAYARIITTSTLADILTYEFKFDKRDIDDILSNI